MLMNQALTYSLYFAVALSIAPLRAQIAGPRLGYVWDPSARTLVSVEGVPGASFLGPAADLALEFETVAVSQHAGFFLGIASGDRRPYLLRAANGTFVPQPIDGVTIHVDRVALSSSGSSAVLYSQSEGVLQVISGLPLQPASMPPVAVSSVDRFAVSDDGSLILFATAAGGPVALPTASAVPLPIPI